LHFILFFKQSLLALVLQKVRLDFSLCAYSICIFRRNPRGSQEMLNTKAIRLGATVEIATLIAGCATNQMGASYRPIIDTRGVDFKRYEADLTDCQQYAHQSMGASDGAAAGAVAGAALGAVLAAAAGSRYSRSQHARVGAVGGAVGTAAEAESSQRSIIRKCLAGRGYSVLQ
jgi:outer membrane lipoprotein SlyB